MRSGAFYLKFSSLLAGSDGLIWSTTATSKLRNGTNITFSAYFMNYPIYGVFTSNGPIERWHGFSLRCLARGGGDHANDNMDHHSDTLPALQG